MKKKIQINPDQHLVNLAAKCGRYPGIPRTHRIEDDLFGWFDDEVELFLELLERQLKYK
jgi:hypothetical protein